MKVEWTNKMLLELMIDCLEDAKLEKIEHIRIVTKGKKVTFEITATESKEQELEIETGSKMDIQF